jgi:hypothetical protein
MTALCSPLSTTSPIVLQTDVSDPGIGAYFVSDKTSEGVRATVAETDTTSRLYPAQFLFR